MKKLISSLLIFFSFWAQAQTKTFDEIWTVFYQKSLTQKSAAYEKVATEEGLKRAERHWLPRVYVTGQWFQTNDPGAVFFNNLGQRSVEQMDFVPNDLNHPGQNTFKSGVIGVDLPLYEGSMKTHQVSMYEALVKASELELKAKKTEEYAELSKKYGSLVINNQSKASLTDLKQGLEKIISTYQVGAQSNPVGYSGLLGLKGVKLRMEGMISQLELQIGNAQNWINSKTEISGSWSIDSNQNIKDFIRTHLSQQNISAQSSGLLAQEWKIQTMDSMKEMEKARFVPRVGLFAQNQIYSGSRDTANSQSLGLYLMWDIFNSDSYGRVGEAGAKALAAQSKLMAYKQEERIMLNQLQESKGTLEMNLDLLEESQKLLREQTNNAMKLFKSGMLNALQLAEVINRRVDLIENKNKVDSQYLEVNSGIYQINN